MFMSWKLLVCELFCLFHFSDDAVKKMVLRRRQCLTHDENFEKLDPEDSEKYKPKLFTHYTMQGCVMECRAKFSLDECGCLPYYYPEFKDAKMCNVTQIQCLSNIAGTTHIDCRLNLISARMVYLTLIVVLH